MHIPASLMSSRTRRRKARRHATFAALLFAVICLTHAHADQLLPRIGGDGGGSFEARCPAGQLLTGFELRAADDVDAIRPLCLTAQGPRAVSAPTPAGGWHGGTGGGPASVVCPGDEPVVTGMYVRWEGAATYVVNNIHVFCGLADGMQSASGMPSAKFDGPPVSGGWTFAGAGNDTQRCPTGQVAVGMHGRSGIWVDSIGLICGESSVSPGGSGIGRIIPETQRPKGWTICDGARDARARNSPAAPALEAQCEASKPPAKAIGRVNVPPNGGGVPASLCERARNALARNSPAAPRLVELCLASGGKP